MHEGYFEGILQLRNPKQEVIDYIRKQVKIKPNVFISNEVKQKNGLDFYLSSQHFLQALGKKIQLAYGGRLITSKKLFSVNKMTSRKTYRITVLVYLTPYSKGDVIKTDNNIFYITALGKKITGLNIKTGKKPIFRYPRDFEVLEKHKTTVSRTRPSIQVLHPETYQSEPLKNRKSVKIGEKVTVVIDNGLWMI